MIRSKGVLITVLVTWAIVAANYLVHTPYSARTHDFGGHLEYTKLIATEHRLPKYGEGWESCQPPLYYLINSYIAPHSLTSHVEMHINLVRFLSVLYGGITILLISWFLQGFVQNDIVKLLVLLFLVTTPKYVLVFSTYNNDSLAMLLSVATLVISYKLYQTWSNYYAFILLIVATAAIYTKLTAVASIITVILICSKCLVQASSPSSVAVARRIIGILLLSFLLLSPWIILHNYRQTHKLFPDNYSWMGPDIKYEQDKVMQVILPTAIFKSDPQKWDVPWVYPHRHPSSKRDDFWSYSFVNSVIGEFIFDTPQVGFVWFLLFIHLVLRLVALSVVLKSSITKLAGFSILVSYIVQVVYFISFPAACTIDYRYICWNWLGWAVLYTYAILNEKVFAYGIVKRIFLLAIPLQVYFLFTVS